MDILAKKLSFIQEFLRISDEEIIDKLEEHLRTERKKKLRDSIKPMSKEKFYQIIDESEKDFESGKVTEANELLKKIDKWK